ncbi:MAG: DUF2953 domain-containing protein [Coprococcus sp.]
MLLLHILLFLLKLIGIVLLVILGLIVLILAIILLTPIRYRIGASKYQTIQAEGKVTWLFRLIEMVFKLDTGAEEGKRLHLSFRIAWLKLYDNQKPKEKRIKQKKTRKTKSKAESKQSEKVIQAAKPEQPEAKVQPIKTEQAAEMKHEEKLIEGPKESAVEKILRLAKNVANKILSLIRGVFSLICSILGIPSKIMDGLEKLENFFTKLREKKEAFLAFYNETHNHQWFTAFWHRLKKLLLRILPRADRLYLHFGFEDPATTGQVLGGLSILYPICGEKMELCPEFNEEILEGEVKCHGRIRPVSLVIFAVKSFLNKQFFSMVKQFKVLLKGE